MTALLNTTIILAASAILVSCGSVSPVKSNATGAASSAAARGKTYTKVLVKDFRNLAADSDQTAGAKFAGIIAGEIMRSHSSANVIRTGTPDASTLVIEGDITRYVEGNAALRLFIGMGAGSSYFDALVRVNDGGNGQNISTLKADKNSWGLGGSIAAGQTVETFMNAAAKKTAQEIMPLLK